MGACDVVFTTSRRSGGDDGCDARMVRVKCDFNCEESCEETARALMAEGLDLRGDVVAGAVRSGARTRAPSERAESVVERDFIHRAVSRQTSAAVDTTFDGSRL